MEYEVALGRKFGEDWRAHVQSALTRIDGRIDDAQARIAEHAAHMATHERSASPELYAVSRDMQQNLEEGLRLLIHQRGILLRELAYIERRKNVRLGLHFKLGNADRMAPAT